MISNVNNKKSALKARIKKTNEKEYMRQFNREQEERFLEFNQMLPKGLCLPVSKVGDEDQMALSDDDQDE